MEIIKYREKLHDILLKFNSKKGKLKEFAFFSSFDHSVFADFI